MLRRTLVVLGAVVVLTAACSKPAPKPITAPRIATAPWLWAGVQRPEGNGDPWPPLVALSDAGAARRKVKFDDPLDGLVGPALSAAKAVVKSPQPKLTFKPYELHMADGTPGVVDTAAVTDAMTAAGRELAENGHADDAKTVSDALLILAYWQLNALPTGGLRHVINSAINMQEGAAKVRAKMDDAKLTELQAPTATELRRWFSTENADLAAWVEAGRPPAAATPTR